jgi:hypothetical protein
LTAFSRAPWLYWKAPNKQKALQAVHLWGFLFAWKKSKIFKKLLQKLLTNHAMRGIIYSQNRGTPPEMNGEKEMTAKERKQIETLRNYIEKAIWKSAEIESNNWKITKVNEELIKLIDLVDEALQ